MLTIIVFVIEICIEWNKRIFSFKNQCASGWQIKIKRWQQRDQESLLRLVFTSDGVGVWIVSGVVRALMTKWKSKLGVVSGVISATESESEESERFHFLPTPLTTPSLTFRLWSSENQIVGVGRRSGRISQSECTFSRFVIGLVLLLLLPTPTIWFSLDHKRNVSDGVVNGIATLFSLDHKLYASDYDSYSDSVASENQP